jgi:hypothetical protein
LRRRYVISHRQPAEVENGKELAQRISGGSRQLVDKCAAARELTFAGCRAMPDTNGNRNGCRPPIAHARFTLATFGRARCAG